MSSNMYANKPSAFPFIIDLTDDDTHSNNCSIPPTPGRTLNDDRTQSPQSTPSRKPRGKAKRAPLPHSISSPSAVRKSGGMPRNSVLRPRTVRSVSAPECRRPRSDNFDRLFSALEGLVETKHSSSSARPSASGLVPTPQRKPSARQLGALDEISADSDYLRPATTSPSPRRRTPSTSTPQEKPFDKIVSIFSSKLSKKQLKQTGHIYIMQSLTCPTKLKIGFTKDLPRARMREISIKCDADLDLISEYTVPSEHIQRAEQLVHAELSDFKTSQPCDCGTTHREWFSVNADQAREVVARWISVMKRRPYDGHGQLRTFVLKQLRLCKDLEAIQTSFTAQLPFLSSLSWHLGICYEILARSKLWWPLYSTLLSFALWYSWWHLYGFALVCACLTMASLQWQPTEDAMFELRTLRKSLGALLTVPGWQVRAASKIYPHTT